MDEKQYVLNSFQQHFKQYQHDSIVIYGLGNNTKHVINAYPEYNIIGLMDEARTGEYVFGKPVLDIKDAASVGTDIIIIIARAANVPIIYHRIARFCETFQIPVFDINGEELSLQKEKSPSSCLICRKKDLLYEKIDSCEIVSFDIFDTILMRRVLIPTDIFLLVEKKIKEKGVAFPFFQERRKAELELLGKGFHPKLSEIYDRMAAHVPSASIHLREWKELEVETEKEYLVARDGMKEVLEYARQSGKQVFFTSDMYLPDDCLTELLQFSGIHAEIRELIVSCEYGTSKNSGLHSVLRKRFPGKRILHVGDNADADGRCAQEAGIDEVFLIDSAYRMLECSQAGSLLQFSDTCESRMLLGDFAAKQFGNPFVFERTRGKISIDTEYELGYYFFAPMLQVFLGWFLQKIEEHRLTRVLLASRDGFIMKQLLDQIQRTRPNLKLPESTYFYTSRAASVLAAVKDEADILYAAKQIPFSGTVEKMLQQRFRLEEGERLPRKADEPDLEYLMRHKNVILKHAAKAREHYHIYLSKLGIQKTDSCGFFDFVSGGTCQYALSKFWDQKLTGLYFLKFFDPVKSELSIEALFQESNGYAKNSALEERYFLLEKVITSFEPTLAGFDEEGRPLFEKETRSLEELNALQQVQRGILDAFQKYTITDESLADEWIRFLGKDYAVCKLPFLQSVHMTDEFCNRRFEVPGF